MKKTTKVLLVILLIGIIITLMAFSTRCFHENLFLSLVILSGAIFVWYVAFRFLCLLANTDETDETNETNETNSSESPLNDSAGLSADEALTMGLISSEEYMSRVVQELQAEAEILWKQQLEREQQLKQRLAREREQEELEEQERQEKMTAQLLDAVQGTREHDTILSNLDRWVNNHPPKEDTNEWADWKIARWEAARRKNYKL